MSKQKEALEIENWVISFDSNCSTKKVIRSRFVAHRGHSVTFQFYQLLHCSRGHTLTTDTITNSYKNILAFDGTRTRANKVDYDLNVAP